MAGHWTGSVLNRSTKIVPLEKVLHGEPGKKSDASEGDMVKPKFESGLDFAKFFVGIHGGDTSGINETR
ncbi:MAG: hypothetical protein AAGC81_01850 [Pseudomonadota bacterium]